MKKPPDSTVLVVGGARSGKSAFAQGQVEASGLAPVFVATGQAGDAEMEARIVRHAAARGPTWTTVEAPYELAAALVAGAGPGRILLVDCLTLWLSNIMLRGDDTEAATQDLVSVVQGLAGPAVFVSNEVGCAIVPENELARRFRDAHGLLNQRIAAVCASAVLVVAGLPVMLKPGPSMRLNFGI